jgi:hypothetical protein
MGKLHPNPPKEPARACFIFIFGIRKPLWKLFKAFIDPKNKTSCLKIEKQSKQK